MVLQSWHSDLQLPDGSAMFPAIEQPSEHARPQTHVIITLNFAGIKAILEKLPPNLLPTWHWGERRWGHPQTWALRAAVPWGGSGGWLNMNYHFFPVSISL